MIYVTVCALGYRYFYLKLIFRVKAFLGRGEELKGGSHISTMAKVGLSRVSFILLILLLMGRGDADMGGIQEILPEDGSLNFPHGSPRRA